MKVFSGRRPPHPFILVAATIVVYVGIGLLAAALIGVLDSGEQPALWAAALVGPLLLVSLILLPLGQLGFYFLLMLSALGALWSIRTLLRASSASSTRGTSDRGRRER